MSDATLPQIDPQSLKIAELEKLLAELTQENKQFSEENKQLK